MTSAKTVNADVSLLSLVSSLATLSVGPPTQLNLSGNTLRDTPQ